MKAAVANMSLSRCAFVLFKIARGDPKAFGNAVEVVQASVKLLVKYGERDEWMEQTHHG